MRAARVILALGGPLVLALAAGAALVERDESGLRRPDAAELDDLHGRWAALSESERDRYRARYAELASLQPEERARITERVRRLDELARMVFGSLDPRTQERLLALDAAKRRELLREMAVDEAGAMGQRILERMSADDRARLEQASEADRLRFLVEFRRRQDQRLEESIHGMAAEIGMSEEELARLETLLPDQRRARFLEIVKRRILHLVEQRGLPEGITAQRWEHASALEPREFYLAVLRLQVDPRTRLPLGKRPPAEETGWERVRRALRPEDDHEARLELAHLSVAERRTQVRARRRAELVEILREEGLFDEALARASAQPSDAAFLAEVRNRLRAGRGER